MPSGSKRKQTDEHGLNIAERLRGACIRRNEHTLQSVSLLKSGKFPAFFTFLPVFVVILWSKH